MDLRKPHYIVPARAHRWRSRHDERFQYLHQLAPLLIAYQIHSGDISGIDLHDGIFEQPAEYVILFHGGHE